MWGISRYQKQLPHLECHTSYVMPVQRLHVIGFILRDGVRSLPRVPVCLPRVFQQDSWWVFSAAHDSHRSKYGKCPLLCLSFPSVAEGLKEVAHPLCLCKSLLTGRASNQPALCPLVAAPSLTLKKKPEGIILVSQPFLCLSAFPQPL